MGKSPKASLSALVMVGAVSLPLLASCTTTATVTRPGTAAPKQLAELKGSDTATTDEFGVSVGVSGSTAVVGTSGAAYAGRAYVFAKTASGWSQVAELKGSDATPGDHFGNSVAISGTTVVVGAYDQAKDAGRAYVFTKTASGWSQVAEPKGSDTVADDYFGWSVAVSGATVVVGAVGHARYMGRAYVFTKTTSGWEQTAELEGSDTVTEDGFGTSVAVSGTMAVVGAEGYAKGAGRAYVFSETEGVWKQTAELKGSDTVTGDNFGTSVALSGTTVVVSSYGQADSAGRAYVFTGTAGVWKQTAELKGSDTAAGDYFGISAAVSGTSAVVGAYDHATDAGRAYVFTDTAGVWKQTAELKGSDTAAGDHFGVSVAVSGTTAVMGSYGKAKYAGRAYVFKS
ncbi:MAG: FG-GAP repeat protein [Acidimicrobiales bacterium]